LGIRLVGLGIGSGTSETDAAQILIDRSFKPAQNRYRLAQQTAGSTRAERSQRGAQFPFKGYTSSR